MTFHDEYVQYKEKIQDFLVANNFETKHKEYQALFYEMNTLSDQELDIYAEQSPLFLEARKLSLRIIERIVEIHDELQEIFNLDEEKTAQRCKDELLDLDRYIAASLQESAALLEEFNEAREAGRIALDEVSDTE